jgi:hypothetical protein
MAFLCMKRGAQSPFLEIGLVFDLFFGLFGSSVGAEISKFWPTSAAVFAGPCAPPKTAPRILPRYTHPAQPRPEKPPGENRGPKTARRKPPAENRPPKNSPKNQKTQL